MKSHIQHNTNVALETLTPIFFYIFAYSLQLSGSYDDD